MCCYVCNHGYRSNENGGRCRWNQEKIVTEMYESKFGRLINVWSMVLWILYMVNVVMTKISHSRSRWYWFPVFLLFLVHIHCNTYWLADIAFVIVCVCVCDRLLLYYLLYYYTTDWPACQLHNTGPDWFNWLKIL